MMLAAACLPATYVCIAKLCIANQDHAPIHGTQLDPSYPAETAVIYTHYCVLMHLLGAYMQYANACICTMIPKS